MKKEITLSQITCIQTLLSKHSLRDEKESIVQSFSGGRTGSLRELRLQEAQMLIGHLKALDPANQKSERMRNKVISFAHEMNWHLTPHSTSEGGGGKLRVDMKRLNNWCIKYSYLHKPLDDYTYEELPKLVTQFEEVYKDYLSKA